MGFRWVIVRVGGWTKEWKLTYKGGNAVGSDSQQTRRQVRVQLICCTSLLTIACLILWSGYYFSFSVSGFASIRPIQETKDLVGLG